MSDKESSAVDSTTAVTFKAGSVREVVEHGLCIGCGLCESVTQQRIRMAMTDYGALRPESLDDFSKEEERIILDACPGVSVAAPETSSSHLDTVWGKYESMCYAWASNQSVRFQSATGGVLTALAQYLIASQAVRFVLHVSADPDKPWLNRWVISQSTHEVLEHGGSRYAPTAPLAGLHEALERRQPFALVAKPCDVSAVSALARHDPRIDEYCTYRLALVCGGQSRMTKTEDLLESFGVEADDVTNIRYRGFGNPGPTSVTTRDNRHFSTTYNELWSDQSSWDLEARCALCPDALGEAADIAAADVWPGGGPEGEDEGFNGVVVRTINGQKLFEDAVRTDAVRRGEAITPRQFDTFQPHQVTKKQALSARFEALTSADKPVPATRGLRIKELGDQQSREQRRATIAGTLNRIANGRFSK